MATSMGASDLNPNQSYTLTITDPPPSVPEPSSLALMSSGLPGPLPVQSAVA